MTYSSPTLTHERRRARCSAARSVRELAARAGSRGRGSARSPARARRSVDAELLGQLPGTGGAGRGPSARARCGGRGRRSASPRASSWRSRLSCRSRQAMPGGSKLRTSASASLDLLRVQGVAVAADRPVAHRPGSPPGVATRKPSGSRLPMISSAISRRRGGDVRHVELPEQVVVEVGLAGEACSRCGGSSRSSDHATGGRSPPSSRRSRPRGRCSPSTRLVVDGPRPAPRLRPAAPRSSRRGVLGSSGVVARAPRAPGSRPAPG